MPYRRALALGCIHYTTCITRYPIVALALGCIQLVLQDTLSSRAALGLFSL